MKARVIITAAVVAAAGVAASLLPTRPPGRSLGECLTLAKNPRECRAAFPMPESRHAGLVTKDGGR